MRAAICYSFGEPLSIEDVDLAPPGTGQVRVEVRACAICHSDIHFMDGEWGGQTPSVYGHEASGIVIEVGEEVANVAVGDHVVVSLMQACGTCYFCSRDELHLCDDPLPDSVIRLPDGTQALTSMHTGAFAEEVVVHHSQVVPIPMEIPLDVASLLACGVITGVGAVRNTANVEPGRSVVVIGAGGVGTNSIQGARIRGASPIIAVDLLDEKLTSAKAFGATDTVNLATDNPIEKVLGLTGGRGADYVFVTVGSGQAITMANELCRRGGTIAIVGMPADGTLIGIEANTFASRSRIILGCTMGSTNLERDIPDLVTRYQNGELLLDELISGRYPFDQINEAIADTRAGGALRNVIVFGGPTEPLPGKTPGPS